MATHILSPFAGKPQTTWKVKRNQSHVATIKLHELTPQRAIAAKTLSGLCTASALIGSVFIVAGTPGASDQAFTIACAAPLLLYFVLKPLFRWALKKTVYVQFTPSLFRIKGFFGWKSFDRTLPHSFALVEHDLTREEKEQHQLVIRRAEMRRRAIRKERYYGESAHLVLLYMGQRRDVMTIYGRKEAERAVSRLQAVDKVMDTLANLGGGTPMKPEDDWTGQPGDIRYG